MFNEELFYKLCDKYEVEIVEGKGKPMLYDNGVLRPLNEEDVKNILNIDTEDVNK